MAVQLLFDHPQSLNGVQVRRICRPVFREWKTVVLEPLLHWFSSGRVHHPAWRQWHDKTQKTTVDSHTGAPELAPLIYCSVFGLHYKASHTTIGGAPPHHQRIREPNGWWSAAGLMGVTTMAMVHMTLTASCHWKFSEVIPEHTTPLLKGSVLQYVTKSKPLLLLSDKPRAWPALCSCRSEGCHGCSTVTFLQAYHSAAWNCLPLLFWLVLKDCIQVYNVPVSGFARRCCRFFKCFFLPRYSVVISFHNMLQVSLNLADSDTHLLWNSSCVVSSLVERCDGCDVIPWQDIIALHCPVKHLNNKATASQVRGWWMRRSAEHLPFDIYGWASVMVSNFCNSHDTLDELSDV